MAFKPVANSGGGDIIKFDTPGTQVTGIYLGAQDFPDGKWGPTVKHIFKTDTGIKVAFFKTNSQPGELMTNATAGQLVRLTFTKTKASKNGGNPQKIYSLDIDYEYTASPEDLTTDEDYAVTPTPNSTQMSPPPSTVNRTAVNNVLKQRSRVQ